MSALGRGSPPTARAAMKADRPRADESAIQDGEAHQSHSGCEGCVRTVLIARKPEGVAPRGSPWCPRGMSSTAHQCEPGLTDQARLDSNIVDACLRGTSHPPCRRSSISGAACSSDTSRDKQKSRPCRLLFHNFVTRQRTCTGISGFRVGRGSTRRAGLATFTRQHAS